MALLNTIEKEMKILAEDYPAYRKTLDGWVLMKGINTREEYFAKEQETTDYNHVSCYNLLRGPESIDYFWKAMDREKVKSNVPDQLSQLYYQNIQRLRFTPAFSFWLQDLSREWMTLLSACPDWQTFAPAEMERYLQNVAVEFHGIANREDIFPEQPADVKIAPVTYPRSLSFNSTAGEISWMDKFIRNASSNPACHSFNDNCTYLHLHRVLIDPVMEHADIWEKATTLPPYALNMAVSFMEQKLPLHENDQEYRISQGLHFQPNVLRYFWHERIHCYHFLTQQAFADDPEKVTAVTGFTARDDLLTNVSSLVYPHQANNMLYHDNMLETLVNNVMKQTHDTLTPEQKHLIRWCYRKP